MSITFMVFFIITIVASVFGIYLVIMNQVYDRIDEKFKNKKLIEFLKKRKTEIDFPLFEFQVCLFQQCLQPKLGYPHKVGQKTIPRFYGNNRS